MLFVHRPIFLVWKIKPDKRYGFIVGRSPPARCNQTRNLGFGI